VKAAGPRLAAIAAVAVAALALPRSLAACAVCFGDPAAPMTHGLNMGILFLFGVVGLVQLAIVKVIWEFRKRGKRLGDPTELRVIRGGKK
jgi:hypothetical protein